MAYNRPPQVTLAGVALRQNPPPNVVQPAGIVPVTLDAEIATTTNLGVVQVGNGLAITPAGVLSATGGGDDGCQVNVKLVNKSYTATEDDCYIGATEKNITITLPKGVDGKVYYIKNQANGNITVKGTGAETIDGSSTKTLGTDGAIIVVFAGGRWNIL
jgi:hypothetical protein